MNANRFISLSMDLWNSPKVKALNILRDEGPMEVTGMFVRFLCLLYDYDGCIDWNDGLVRGVVSDALCMGEDECGAFIDDLARVRFIDGPLWESERHAISKGVADEIAYRKGKAESGKKGGRAPKSKA